MGLNMGKQKAIEIYGFNTRQSLLNFFFWDIAVVESR